MTFFILADTAFIALAVIFSFMLRFDGVVPVQYIEGGIIQNMIILALVFSLPTFYFLGLYSFSWSFVSANELISLFKAITLSFLFLAFSIFFLKSFQGFPRSAIIISYFLVFIFCGGTRFSKRIYLEIFKSGNKGQEKTLIVGAGQAGEEILRSIKSSKESHFSPIGFVDDNLSKQGVSIHGLQVLGKIEDIPTLVEKKKVESLVIALPSAGASAVKKAVELGREAGLEKIKVVPPISDVIEGTLSVRDLREIKVEDLLGREPVSLDMKAIEKFIGKKKVLITGAAGSIGSELARQVAKFNPSQLILLDQDETGIFNISQELKKNTRIGLKYFVTDVTDKESIRSLFKECKPAIIFHAAAYKHVPLMEQQPQEAVKNNIFGTKNVAEASLDNEAEKFVFISTDKAVNPTSIMGATKRAGEMICQALNQKNHTKFISVRFGNVLDSRGSVIPIFKDQIKKGGPVEVTHSEMKRYFMMIPEAVLLVMQAGEMGQGGEVFVLDMGKPVKIVDLAKEMIRLSGFEPDKEIPIVFTRPRPGEKLFEELLTSEEGTLATQNKRIFKARLSEIDESFLERKLNKLQEKENIKEGLKELIPSYLTK